MNKGQNCGLCHKVSKDDILIQCQKPDCQSWYHGLCVNIPKHLGLRFIRVLGQFNWTCPGCCIKEQVPCIKLSIFETNIPSGPREIPSGESRKSSRNCNLDKHQDDDPPHVAVPKLPIRLSPRKKAIIKEAFKTSKDNGPIPTSIRDDSSSDFEETCDKAAKGSRKKTTGSKRKVGVNQTPTKQTKRALKKADRNVPALAISTPEKANNISEKQNSPPKSNIIRKALFLQDPQEPPTETAGTSLWSSPRKKHSDPADTSGKGGDTALETQETPIQTDSSDSDDFIVSPKRPEYSRRSFTPRSNKSVNKSPVKFGKEQSDVTTVSIPDSPAMMRNEVVNLKILEQLEERDAIYNIQKQKNLMIVSLTRVKIPPQVPHAETSEKFPDEKKNFDECTTECDTEVEDATSKLDENSESSRLRVIGKKDSERTRMSSDSESSSPRFVTDSGGENRDDDHSDASDSTIPFGSERDATKQPQKDDAKNNGSDTEVNATTEQEDSRNADQELPTNQPELAKVMTTVGTPVTRTRSPRKSPNTVFDGGNSSESESEDKVSSAGKRKRKLKAKTNGSVTKEPSSSSSVKVKKASVVASGDGYFGSEESGYEDEEVKNISRKEVANKSVSDAQISGTENSRASQSETDNEVSFKVNPSPSSANTLPDPTDLLSKDVQKEKIKSRNENASSETSKDDSSSTKDLPNTPNQSTRMEELCQGGVTTTNEQTSQVIQENNLQTGDKVEDKKDDQTSSSDDSDSPLTSRGSARSASPRKYKIDTNNGNSKKAQIDSGENAAAPCSKNYDKTSSSESSDEDNAPPTHQPPKSPPKTGMSKKAHQTSTSDSSDEDNIPPTHQPPKTPPKTGMSKKADQTSTSESSDEDNAPLTHQLPKTPPKTGMSKKADQTSTSESSDEDNIPPTHQPPKTQPKTGMSKKVDQTSTSESSNNIPPTNPTLETPPKTGMSKKSDQTSSSVSSNKDNTPTVTQPLKPLQQTKTNKCDESSSSSESSDDSETPQDHQNSSKIDQKQVKAASSSSDDEVVSPAKKLRQITTKKVIEDSTSESEGKEKIKQDAERETSSDDKKSDPVLKTGQKRAKPESSEDSDSDESSEGPSGATSAPSSKKICDESSSSESSEDEMIIVISPGQKMSPSVRSSDRKIPPKDRSALDSYLKKREEKLKGQTKPESKEKSDKSDDSEDSDSSTASIKLSKKRTNPLDDSESEKEENLKNFGKRKLRYGSEDDDDDEESAGPSTIKKSKPHQNDEDSDLVSKKKKHRNDQDEEEEAELEALENDDEGDGFVVGDDEVEYESDLSSGSSSESDDDEVPKISHTKLDVRSEMEKLMKKLSRQTDNDLKNRDLFLSPSQSTVPDKHTKNKLRSSTEKKVIYKPLLNGLRPMASRKDLTPAEILSEWKLYATLEDPECGGECVCGKTGLRWLNWMHNKNIKDEMKRTLEHKVCIGSECIHWFNKCLQKAHDDEAIDSPIVLFDIMLRKGIVAFYRGEEVLVVPKAQKKKEKKKKSSKTDERIFIFSFKGIYAEYLRDNIAQIRTDYNFELKVRPECVEIKVCSGPNLVLHPDESLEMGAKYRIFIKTDVEIDSKNPEHSSNATFRLTRFEKSVAGSSTSPTSDEQRSAKSFLR